MNADVAASVPLWLLYEAGIVVAGWATKKSA